MTIFLGDLTLKEVKSLGNRGQAVDGSPLVSSIDGMQEKEVVSGQFYVIALHKVEEWKDGKTLTLGSI